MKVEVTILKAREVPGMLHALKDLEPYFLMFYRTFEVSFYKAKNYFDSENTSSDVHLHANLIRYWAKVTLRQHDIAADFEAEELNNSGIQLTIPPWFIRIRKSARGAMPQPGHSKRLQAYYQQNLSPEFAEPYNLLLLWHATSTGDFKGLSLVYPLSAYTCRWHAEIPHPATSAHAKTIYQRSFDQVDYIKAGEDIGDLEIEPLEEQEDQGTGAESL